MHILLFHDSQLPPEFYGGIERIVVTLAEGYLRLGHKVSVLCKDGSQIPGAQMIALPQGWKTQDFENLIPADVNFIHAHQPLRREPKRPYLVTIHGNGHREEKYFPNTNFLSRSHARNHRCETFIYNGVDPHRYDLTKDKNDYFVFLAKTTWRVKNLKTAIAWANDLKVKLKIIGGHGLSRGHIEYLGYGGDELKNDVVGKARALIYPTNWDEPCAVAPLEALACGTPVIATGNGCMPELVQHGKTGIICRTYNELLQAPGLLKNIKPKDCRESVEKFFSVERMCSDYVALFTKILRDGNLVGRDNAPRYNFKKESVTFLFKPTLFNQARLLMTGKI